MGKKNGFLEKQKARDQAIFDAGERIGMQKMWDYLQLALRNPDVVSKDIFGKGRFEKIFAEATRLADVYHPAFTAHKEADYMQEQMDAQLREIWGDDLQPFYDRYPELKRYDYKKAQKGWVD